MYTFKAVVMYVRRSVPKVLFIIISGNTALLSNNTRYYWVHSATCIMYEDSERTSEAVLGLGPTVTMMSRL